MMPLAKPDLLVVEIWNFDLGMMDAHYARPGHVNALCGRERISNSDVAADSPYELPTCPDCLALASRDGYLHPLRPGRP